MPKYRNGCSNHVTAADYENIWNTNTTTTVFVPAVKYARKNKFAETPFKKKFFVFKGFKNVFLKF